MITEWSGLRRAWLRGCLLGLAGVLVLPSLVSAQANSLFPDIYIKRKRPCCTNEDPRHQHIREQYFGYYPTCWRRFPPGWGCPSPDAPNWEEALRKLPLELPEAGTGTGTEPMPGVETDPFLGPAPGEAPRPARGLPELPPDEGSLFPGAAPPSSNPDDPFAEPSVPRADGTPRTTGLGRDGGTGAGLSRLYEEEAPVLAAPAATLPGAMPGAASGGMMSSGVGEMPAREAHGRRGILSQLMNRSRRR